METHTTQFRLPQPLALHRVYADEPRRAGLPHIPTTHATGRLLSIGRHGKLGGRSFKGSLGYDDG